MEKKTREQLIKERGKEEEEISKKETGGRKGRWEERREKKIKDKSLEPSKKKV